MPTPTAADVAIRDTIRAILRDHPDAIEAGEIAELLPAQSRLLRQGGAAACVDDHAAIRRHSCMALRHCFGSDGHVVEYRLSALEVHAHCRALHVAGYVEQVSSAPVRWTWRPPRAGTLRGVEAWEAQEFAALMADWAGEGPAGPTLFGRGS